MNGSIVIFFVRAIGLQKTCDVMLLLDEVKLAFCTVLNSKWLSK